MNSIYVESKHCVYSPIEYEGYAQTQRGKGDNMIVNTHLVIEKTLVLQHNAIGINICCCYLFGY